MKCKVINLEGDEEYISIEFDEVHERKTARRVDDVPSAAECCVPESDFFQNHAVGLLRLTAKMQLGLPDIPTVFQRIGRSRREFCHQ